MVTIDALARGEYVLLAEMTHAELLPFVKTYFLDRGSWLTRAHHAMSLATLAAIVAIAIRDGVSILECLGAFGLAFIALFVVVLPLHEALHAIAYRLVGARDIRWNYSVRMLAVWVIADRFVAGRGAFLVVALAPFVVINAILIAAAIAIPAAAVHLLFVLLWHLHGASGDWALLNFMWLHRERGFWTYDDAEAGKSYFFGRVA